MQHREPTHLLAGLLAGGRASSTSSSVGRHRAEFRARHTGRYKRLLPGKESPGGIAALTSLLADSKLYHYIPEATGLVGCDSLIADFVGKAVRLGWFADSESEE
jgi:hypothetical protein